jgi:hypothetical protein
MADDYSRERYVAAAYFLRELRYHRDRLTRQQLRTLRGQALSGDIAGAMRGLGEILMRKENGECKRKMT